MNKDTHAYTHIQRYKHTVCTYIHPQRHTHTYTHAYRLALTQTHTYSHRHTQYESFRPKHPVDAARGRVK